MSHSSDSLQQVRSADRCEPGSFPLQLANLPTIDESSLGDFDPHTEVAQWVATFNEAAKASPLGIANLFLVESYWRDHLCLTWDFHTIHGPAEILSLLEETKGCRIRSMALDTSSEIHSPTVTAGVIQAFVVLETSVGKGVGILRLVKNEDGIWKCFTLYTFLKELTGYPASVGKDRPLGVLHGENILRKNWSQIRSEEISESPTVIIVGAGQAGLSTAARLRSLGIKTLIVDREKKIGDNWRSRYQQLVLHDPVWFDHMPFIPFPETWPVFTPKDKLGNWLEAYATLMDLDVWTETEIAKSSWDQSSGKWKVTINRFGVGRKLILHPTHIIQATGASGEPDIHFNEIPGISTFKGKIFHSSEFPGATPSGGNLEKKVVVVGCCNSGHDIAQDYYENGHSVTIIQRSSTLVISANTMRSSLAGLYGENSPTTEVADMLFHSFPNPVLKRLNIESTRAHNTADEEILQGLEGVGFTLDKGPDDSGLWVKYLQRGGGYYLDVGCSKLIAEKKIAIKSGHTITKILPHSIIFDDGEELQVDEIIFATGYLNMRTQTRKIFGDAVADKVKDVWGFDEEGEVRTVWRKTGHKNFWVAAGNLGLC